MKKSVKDTKRSSAIIEENVYSVCDLRKARRPNRDSAGQ